MSESTTEDGKIDRKAVTYGRNILTVGVRKPYGRGRTLLTLFRK